jgi:L-amino acid N-acyltransferase YncA
MKIREALEADLPTIIAIYNASIPGRLATADTEAISVESRREWFKQHNPTKHPLWVLEINHNITGWLSFQPFYGRPAYDQTAEVSIYISPAWQRQGIGKQLLQTAIIRSPQLNITTLLAFIFAHNKASLNLFQQYNFQQWGYLPQVAQLDGIKRDLIILGRHL